MRRSWLWLFAPAFCLPFTVGKADAQAANATRASVVFADIGTLNLSLDDLRTGSFTVAAKNGSGDSIASMVLTVEALRRLEDGRPAEFIHGDTGRKIPAGMTANIRLWASPIGDLPAGTYVGTLRVLSERGTASREIRLNVPGIVPVRAWSLYVNKPVPGPFFQRGESNEVIPTLSSVPPRDTGVRKAATAGKCVRPAVLVAQSNDRTLDVCTLGVDTIGAHAAIKLRLGEVGRVGTYVGTLHPPGAAEADSVQLSVVVADWFLWPAIVVVIGVFVAVVSQHYLGSRRANWLMLLDVYHLRKRWAKARKQYDASGAPDYTMAGDFDARWKKLVGTVTDASLPLVGEWKDTDPTYAAIATEIAKLNEATLRWTQLADDFTLLRTTANVAEAATKRLNGPTVNALKKKEALFAPTASTLTVETTIELKSDVEREVSFLKRWAALVGEFVPAEKALSAIEEAAQHNPKIRTTLSERGAPLDTALGNAAGARASLCSARTVDRLDDDQVDEFLRTVLRCIAVANAIQAGSPVPESAPVPSAAAKRDLIKPERAKQQTPGTIVALIRRADISLVILALTAGIAGWYVVSYAGKPFGTLPDYINAFLWGFAMKAGLEALQTVLQNLRTHQLRVP